MELEYLFMGYEFSLLRRTSSPLGLFSGHMDPVQITTMYFDIPNTGCVQKNGAVSKVNKKLTSHLTREQRTPSAAETVQVSHALPAIRFSCLMRGRGANY